MILSFFISTAKRDPIYPTNSIKNRKNCHFPFFNTVDKYELLLKINSFKNNPSNNTYDLNTKIIKKIAGNFNC